jgi:hypothetical protein
MEKASEHRWAQPQLWIELFVIANIGFLTFDIYLAHSVNQFSRAPEYFPLYFSASAPALLLVGLHFRNRWAGLWSSLGYVVGGASVLIGLVGVVFHLESRFFYERTILSLTYSAPFAAPLAYTGLGFLLIMNRMVKSNAVEWAQWVQLFTLGGFIGNFVFTLSDHAVNGFFNPLEWIPVIASAIAIGFLTVSLVTKVSRSYVHLTAFVLLLEAAVGVWGFLLHALSNLRGPSIHAFDNFVYGAPPLAPLLFPNLVVLGLIGIWRFRQTLA